MPFLGLEAVLGPGWVIYLRGVPSSFLRIDFEFLSLAHWGTLGWVARESAESLLGGGTNVRQC